MIGIIIAAVLCMLSVVFFALKKHMTDSCRGVKNGYVIVPCTADTKDLEKTVKAFYWEEVFESEELGREILIVHMEKNENYYTARMLEQEYSIVKAVDISELTEYLKKKELSCYNRREFNGKTGKNSGRG